MKLLFGCTSLVTATRYTIRIVFALLLSGCLSPINLETVNLAGVLAVQGQVSNIADQNRISLGHTAETDRLPIPLSDASITLFDDLGNSYSYQEDDIVPGSYVLNGIEGIPGRTYHIKIITPSGEIYESVPETMPDVTAQFVTSYEIVSEEYTDFEGTILTQPFVKIRCNIALPSSEKSTYLRWFIQEDFLLSPTDFPDPFNAIPPPCFVTQNADPQTLVLVDVGNIKTSTIDNLLIGSRIVDWSFLERHYFTTYQSSLTKEAYEYWRKVNILANQVGSIFDTPPAEIQGNVFRVDDPEEKVLGYFQAANQSLDRFFLLPSDFPFPLLMEPCTYYNYKFTYPSRCIDCLSARNSSYRRPEWF
jgi:hypothetical protein